MKARKPARPQNQLILWPEQPSMYLKNGKYYFSGQVPATQIAERYGTPVYVYEADLIERQYRRLQDAFSIQRRIYYACKANTNRRSSSCSPQLGAGLDCVSIQEVQLGILGRLPAIGHPVHAQLCFPG